LVQPVLSEGADPSGRTVLGHSYSESQVVNPRAAWLQEAESKRECCILIPDARSVFRCSHSPCFEACAIC